MRGARLWFTRGTLHVHAEQRVRRGWHVGICHPLRRCPRPGHRLPSGLGGQPGRRRHHRGLGDERRRARRRGRPYHRELHPHAYDSQEFNFAGPYGENSFLEDYTAWVRGEQLGNVVLVTRNAAGQAQHVVANYRPRSTLLLLSRLIGEHFAGTPYGEHFATSAPE